MGAFVLLSFPPGAVLALWLVHRHLLSLPVAIQQVTEYSASQGCIRRPTLEGVLELLMATGSAISSSPQQQHHQHAVAAAARAALSSRKPPRCKDLHFTCIQTGGTIDKVSIGGRNC